MVARKGAWYSYGDTRLGQGREKTLVMLEDDTGLSECASARHHAMHEYPAQHIYSGWNVLSTCTLSWALLPVQNSLTRCTAMPSFLHINVRRQRLNLLRDSVSSQITQQPPHINPQLNLRLMTHPLRESSYFI